MLNRMLNRLLLIVLLLLLVVLAGSLLIKPVSGDSDLARIENAIEAKGLSWVPVSYDRTFALGAFIEDEPAPEPEPSGEPATLPPSIDWRTAGGVNWVSPVGDQGPCGSCWAFAAVSTLESEFRMQNGVSTPFYDLSEQIVVSCDETNLGCGGGWMRNVAKFLKAEGTYIETCYPYIALDGDCADACTGWHDSALRIDDYEKVSRSVVSLKVALQYHTLPTCFYMYEDFGFYWQGVYEYAWGSECGGHCVQLVGYQDTPGEYGGGYFICKNSWSEDWGEDGFFRIGYSQVTNDVGFGRNGYIYTVSPRPIVETWHCPTAWYAMQGGE